VLFRILVAVVHGNAPDRTDTFRQTRTYLLNPLAAFLFAPHQVNFHLEHHLYPSVPYYRLPELHRWLMQTDYVGKNPAIEKFEFSLRSLVK